MLEAYLMSSYRKDVYMAAKKNKITEEKKKKAPAAAPVAEPKKTTRAKKEDKPEKQKPIDNAPPSSKMIHQFIPFILWVVAILIATCFIGHSIFNAQMGVAGNAIGDLFGGLLGIGAILIPIMIISLAVSWHKFVDTFRVGTKSVFASLIILFFSILLHAFVIKEAKFDIASLWEKGMELKGGGVLGGMLCELLFKLFERIGTVIISLACLAICVMFFFSLTPKNIYTYIKYYTFCGIICQDWL